VPLRLVPARANGQPAFGWYRPTAPPDIAHASSLVVLTLEDGRRSALTWVTDTSVLLHFGLPLKAATGTRSSVGLSA
jgi:RNA polymerase sigma-70 factor (ECF subfamily)